MKHSAGKASAIQLNKRSPANGLQVASPAQELESWRNNVRDHPLNVYIGKRRVVHTGNWLVKVSPNWTAVQDSAVHLLTH